MTTVWARLASGLARGAGRQRAAARPAWPVRLVQQDVARRGLARGADRVVLRPLSVRDEAAWRALRLADDARLTPWEATVPAEAGQEPPSFGRYARAQNRAARRGESFPFVIEVDGRVAGQVTVGPVQWGSVRQAMVGYWIGGPWEGRGIMTLALAMVIDHLLSEEVGLHRVEVNVRPTNARSLAVCRRLGLHEEGLRLGLMHIDGAWADHLGFVALSDGATAPGGAGAPGPGFVARLEAVVSDPGRTGTGP